MKIVLVFLASLVGIVFLTLVYHGIFISVKISEKKMKEYTLAYEEFKGPYRNTKVAFDRVYKTLIEDLKVIPKLGAGLYLDNPSEVKPENCRSEVGSLIEDYDLDKIEKIKEKLKVKTIKAGKAVVAEFRIKSVLSYMIGPMKIYPAFEKYFQEKGYNSTFVGFEIYDIKNSKILYVMYID